MSLINVRVVTTAEGPQDVDMASQAEKSRRAGSDIA